MLMGGKWSMILLDVIFTCCRDIVTEVRMSGLLSVPHAVVAFLEDAILVSRQRQADSSIFQPLVSLITAVCSMYKDISIQVKQTLCQILSKLLTLLYSISLNNTYFTSNESIIFSLESNLSNTILQLLIDSDHEVSTEMISQFQSILEKEQINGESSYISLIFIKENSKLLISCLEKLSKQTNWRVRKLICSIIPKLVSTITTVDARNLVSNIIISLIQDPVFDVRKSAARSLCLSANNVSNLHLIDDMGRGWLDCVVLPQLETLRTSRIYSNRILSLHMITILIIEDIIQENDIRYKLLIEISLTLSNDRVPNVRIALCEVISEIIPVLKNNIQSIDEIINNKIEENLLYKIYEMLNQLLAKETDKDVKYFCSKALQILESNPIGKEISS